MEQILNKLYVNNLKVFKICITILLVISQSTSMNDIILMAPLYGFNELKNIVSRRRKMEKKCYQ